MLIFVANLSILLMDNAKIHHVDSVYATMDQYDLDHIYLPPYSF